MKLSIIVINHNLCPMLRKSIDSLINGSNGIDYELIVVDNASTDKSVDMVAREFPNLQLILNDSNFGFSKAANQAIRISRGEYVFMVSPDTLANKDSLDKMLTFMDLHPAVGGVSVKMLTPMGDFIKESRHTVSSLWMAFFKLIGLYKFLPKSQFFSSRKADWVEEFENAEIDMLNNNCMLLRKSVLNKIGLFDERFINFGSNIDLSYRIRLAGFKNYYFAHTYLIHFNLPGFDKLSWDYVSQYYGAMFIFAAKHLLKLPVINLKHVGGLFPSSYEVER